MGVKPPLDKAENPLLGEIIIKPTAPPRALLVGAGLRAQKWSEKATPKQK